MKHCWINPAGISALNLIGEKISFADCLKAEEMLKLNYGVEFPKEKFSMLWQMLVEEGWTKHRLETTIKWLLKNKKYATWTVADFFEYDVKVFPYSWYLEELHKLGGTEASQQFEAWKLPDGSVVWKYKDGHTLPFEKVFN